MEALKWCVRRVSVVLFGMVVLLYVDKGIVKGDTLRCLSRISFGVLLDCWFVCLSFKLVLCVRRYVWFYVVWQRKDKLSGFCFHDGSNSSDKWSIIVVAACRECRYDWLVVCCNEASRADLGV